MREYRKRPEVKARAHEYYLKKIIEESADKKARDNEELHAKNTERFTNDT